MSHLRILCFRDPEYRWQPPRRTLTRTAVGLPVQRVMIIRHGLTWPPEEVRQWLRGAAAAAAAEAGRNLHSQGYPPVITSANNTRVAT